MFSSHGADMSISGHTRCLFDAAGVCVGAMLQDQLFNVQQRLLVIRLKYGNRGRSTRQSATFRVDHKAELERIIIIAV